jgi:hypothetical protein
VYTRRDHIRKLNFTKSSTINQEILKRIYCEKNTVNLRQTTREIIKQVEITSGYQVEVQKDPNLPVLATVRMARSPVPAHFLIYKPDTGEEPDFLICYQCAFILRLFTNPPDQRFDIASLPGGYAKVTSELTKPGGYAEQLGLDGITTKEYARKLVDGLIVHLRSVPVGLRIHEWFDKKYPEFHGLQRKQMLKEIAEGRQSLEPEVKVIVPDTVFDATIAINAALALFAGPKCGQPELASPYRFGSYLEKGEKLLRIWEKLPDDPTHDRTLIDSWAETIGIRNWYHWIPYISPL